MTQLVGFEKGFLSWSLASILESRFLLSYPYMLGETFL